MENHPPQEHIERYVTRGATIDDSLSIAQHLDNCDECRRVAARLEGESSSARFPRTMTAVPTETGRAIWLTFILVLSVAITVVILLAYK